MIRLLMTIGFALVTTQASAQVAVPKSYVDGEVIHADEPNTNLEAIAGAVPPRTCTTDQIIKWNGVCEIITNDVSVSVFSTIQSSAPVDIIAPPIELIWE